MVFPKPGLEYRYKFNLPDHLERKQKPQNRDHTKIYEYLSDEDLFDIRGVGLLKLDQEEAARIEKENQAAGKSEADAKDKNKNGLQGAKKKPRASLIDDLKNRPRPSTKPVVKKIKEEIHVENSIEDTTVVKKEKVAPAAAADVKVDKVQGPNRERKRKASEIEKVETIVVIPEDAKNDDSSKENDALSGAELSLLSNRNKKEPNCLVSPGPQLKMWRVCNDSDTAPQLTPEGKQTFNDDQNNKLNDELCQMNSGRVKIKLSALNAYATWFLKKQANKKSKQKKKRKEKVKKDKKADPKQKQSTTVSVKKEKKVRRPYKKRAPSNLPPKENTKKKQIRQPQKQLTAKQASRRTRYSMEKHFSAMPGMKYRCPKLTDKAVYIHGHGHLKTTVWICLVCHREELDDGGDIMVCCDRCEDWYHLRCVGVPDERYPVYLRWYCKRCMSRQIRTGTFNESNFPLYN